MYALLIDLWGAKLPISVFICNTTATKKRIKMYKICVLLIGCIWSCSAFSGEHYQSGNIKNITAVSTGLLIQMDTGLPGHCAGTPYGWMHIDQRYTALVSLVLTVWASGSKTGTVYTSGIKEPGGYCKVNQFDPKD